MISEQERRERYRALRARLGMTETVDEVYWAPESGAIIAFERLLDKIEALEKKLGVIDEGLASKKPLG